MVSILGLVDKRLRPYYLKTTRYGGGEVSILGLVDKRLRHIGRPSPVGFLRVSILGLVDKRLRRKGGGIFRNASGGFNPWFSG